MVERRSFSEPVEARASTGFSFSAPLKSTPIEIIQWSGVICVNLADCGVWVCLSGCGNGQIAVA
jgi:hypothetical protein